MADQGVKLFISCVSDEFRGYRNALRHALTRPNVEVKIQEDFKALGGDTLRMLEDYIEQCEAVVHFVGEMTGSTPAPSSVEDLLARRPGFQAKLAKKGVAREALVSLSYTQWEAWLAIGFDRDLLIVAPAKGVDRGPRFDPTAASRALQADHLKRLRAIDRYPGPPFTSADDLIAQIFASAIIDGLVKAAAAAPPRRPRNLPFASLGPLFMGRDGALDALRAAFTSAKTAAVAIIVLRGLGGAGKTQLAIEYALRHESDYSALLFVRADDPATLDANLAALAGRSVLGLPEKEAAHDAVKIEAALRWLEAHPTWLMILDNVDDEKAVATVNKLMARLKGGHVIVTARAANFPASLRKLELDVLHEDAATEFLLARTRDDRARADDDAVKARELARELGGLALVLEHAGAYIARQRIGFSRYLALWREIREGRRPGYTDGRASQKKWYVSYAWADDSDPKREQKIDALCADAEKRGLQIVRDRATLVHGDRISEFMRQIGEGDRVFVFLSDKYLHSPYCMFELFEMWRNNRQNKSDFLRRVRFFTVDGAKIGKPRDWLEHAKFWKQERDDLGKAIDEVGWRIAGDEAIKQYKLVETFAGNISDVLALFADVVSPPTFEDFLKFGFHDPSDGGPQGADTAAERNFITGGLAATWAASADRLSPESRRLLDRLAMLAPDSIPESLLDVAVPGEASDYDAQKARAGLYAYSLITRATDEDGSAQGFVMHRLVQDFARLAMTKERREEALREALRWVNGAFVGDPDDVRNWPVLDPLAPHALAVARRADEAGIAAPTGRLFNHLGLLLRTKARYAEAEPLYRRALAIGEATLGSDHPNVAIGLNNLANLLRETNRPGEAEPLHRRALAIREASYGSVHPDVAQSLNNLALLLKATNRLGEAEPLYRRALAIGEATLGPNHRKVALHLNNLAELLRDTNRSGEAEPLYRRALAIGEATLGPNHPKVALRLNNLAELLRDTNRPGEAEPLYRRALAIFEKSYGPDHPNVATGLNNLALLLQDTNRLGEAEPLYRRALAIIEKSLGADHPRAVTVRRNLAALEAERNRRT